MDDEPLASPRDERTHVERPGSSPDLVPELAPVDTPVARLVALFARFDPAGAFACHLELDEACLVGVRPETFVNAMDVTRKIGDEAPLPVGLRVRDRLDLGICGHGEESRDRAK